MIRTITMGTHVSVQGVYVRTLASGKIIVRVGERMFEAFPVAMAA